MTLKVVLMITKEKQRTPNVVLQSHKATVTSRQFLQALAHAAQSRTE